jgi:two-component system chemotaxis response regulator CheB
MKAAVRVLIVEDSRTQCELLHKLLADDPGIEVVGEAYDGLEAIDLARRLRPDVITMDLQMPRLGGLEAIDQIMVEAPSRVIVVCAVDDQRQLDLSFRAVAAGALELIAKPRGDRAKDMGAWARTLRESIHLMAEVPVVRRRRTSLGDAVLSLAGRRVDAFAIGASTGGPPVLATVLAALPANLSVPLFVAQHMATGFANGLVRWLSQVTPLRVVIAEQGVHAAPGHVYLPPDDCDLLVGAGGALRVERASDLPSPSADRLFASLAEVYRHRAGGVVLTGMGDDGAEGTRALRASGGIALAQDQGSCTVFGMPRAAQLAGALAVPIGELPTTIRGLASPARASF